MMDGEKGRSWGEGSGAEVSHVTEGVLWGRGGGGGGSPSDPRERFEVIVSFSERF